jgi:hypothetical protein
MGILAELFGSGGQLKKDSLPVYVHYKDAPEDSWFRLTDDPPTTIRIRQSYAAELLQGHDTVEEYRNTMVAGTSHRPEAVNSFVLGTNQTVFVKHEPLKGHPNALAVHGTWKDKGGHSQNKQLGYVPSEEAKEIAKQVKTIPDHTFAAKLWALFLPTRKKSAGIRFDLVVLRPALPRFQVHGIAKDTGRKRRRTYKAIDEEDAIRQAWMDRIVVDTKKIKRL